MQVFPINLIGKTAVFSESLFESPIAQAGDSDLNFAKLQSFSLCIGLSNEPCLSF
jgi:hypothetical protein